MKTLLAKMRKEEEEEEKKKEEVKEDSSKENDEEKGTKQAHVLVVCNTIWNYLIAL